MNDFVAFQTSFSGGEPNETAVVCNMSSCNPKHFQYDVHSLNHLLYSLKSMHTWSDLPKLVWGK